MVHRAAGPSARGQCCRFICKGAVQGSPVWLQGMPQLHYTARGADGPRPALDMPWICPKYALLIEAVA